MSIIQNDLIIEDPIGWQSELDRSDLPLNMRGSLRFWSTVEFMSGIEVVSRDGAPEFGEIVFRLSDNVGLMLSTSEGDTWIRFSFCEISSQ